MTEENSKLAENLNQLRVELEEKMSGIEAFKETADASLIGNIEQIERDGMHLIMDIEALQKKIAKEQSDLLDR